MINETIRKKLGLPPEKVPSTLHDFGNTSSASVPLTMTARLRELLGRRPATLLLSGFGIGLVMGQLRDRTQRRRDARADRSVTDDPFSLDGKRILVTGASSGIGRQIADRVCRAWARLIVSGRDEAPRLARNAVQLMQGRATHAIRRTWWTAAARDALAASRGISTASSTARAFRGFLPFAWRPRSISQKSGVSTTRRRYCLPSASRKRVDCDRRIDFFMSSIAAYIGVAGVGVYSGTKAALIATMRCLAMEVVKRGIRVNCLAPALVETRCWPQRTSRTGRLTTNRRAIRWDSANPKTSRTPRSSIYRREPLDHRHDAGHGWRPHDQLGGSR